MTYDLSTVVPPTVAEIANNHIQYHLEDNNFSKGTYFLQSI
jgi:hypothetical protein